MRVVLLTAFYLLWAALVAAQTPVQAVAGRSYTVVAEHDGGQTDGYRLRDGATLVTQQPVTTLLNGLVSFPWTATAGDHTLSVSAYNAVGETPSTPLLVFAAQAPTTPTLGPCPYTSPSGVTSTKPIGDTSVQGWNTYDFTKLVDVQRLATRIQQLAAWGFSVQVTQLNKPKNQVYLLATCVGVVSATPPPPPPPTDRQSIPPLTSITAPDGAVWTLNGFTLVRNGAAVGIGTEIVLTGGTIYMITEGRWYRWSGSAWVLYGPIAP